MKKGLKITLIIIGVILLILLNVCVGAILINNDKTKKMLDDYSNIYTNDKYQEVVSVDNLNYIKQDVSCGYAVIEMFAKWRGNEEITEKYLYDKYGKVVTSTGKSFEEEMNKQFPEFKTTMYKNLKSSELIDKVYDSLLKGVPVPFEWAAKYEDKWTLHYSIVTAMDIPNDKVTIMNPYGYEENISIKEFIDRTSFEAYDHMPIIFKLGFAFNIFEKNTIFIVDMPQVLDGAPGDGTPSVGAHKGMCNLSFENRYEPYKTNSNDFRLVIYKVRDEPGGADPMAFCFRHSLYEKKIYEDFSSGKMNGKVAMTVLSTPSQYENDPGTYMHFEISPIKAEDNMEVYRYDNGEYTRVECEQKHFRDKRDFIMTNIPQDRESHFVFVKTN